MNNMTTCQGTFKSMVLVTQDTCRLLEPCAALTSAIECLPCCLNWLEMLAGMQQCIQQQWKKSCRKDICSISPAGSLGPGSYLTGKCCVTNRDRSSLVVDTKPHIWLGSSCIASAAASPVDCRPMTTACPAARAACASAATIGTCRNMPHDINVHMRHHRHSNAALACSCISCSQACRLHSLFSGKRDSAR